MSVSARQIKELETKLSDKLLDNLTLLSLVHPTTANFDKILKHNLFLKPDKEAFQQIIYFLLNTLDPDMVKTKVKAWPLYDVKIEGVFRREVLACIAHINSTYEHAHLPPLSMSRLMSPGGLKFLQFIFKFSNLVVAENLKKSAEVNMELLHPIKHHKDSRITDIMIGTLKSKIKVVNNEIEVCNKEFYKFCENATELAASIVEDQSCVEKELLDNNKKISELKAKCEAYCPINNLEEVIQNLETKNLHIKELSVLTEDCLEMLGHAVGDQQVLEYKKDNLNLQALFNDLYSVLDKACSELPFCTEGCLNEWVQSLSDVSVKYSKLNSKFSLQYDELIQLSENVAN